MTPLNLFRPSPALVLASLAIEFVCTVLIIVGLPLFFALAFGRF